MKMIVGLGNPGQKYVGTRHNIGFEIVGRLAVKNSAPPPRLKFEAEYSEIRIGDQRVVLLCPLTYMNLSGRSVAKASRFFKIAPEDLLVVCDDFNLKLSRVRFRPAGSAGGQNGLDNIIRMLGTDVFPRLRVGIGPVPDGWNPADFVLGKFTTEELERLNPVVDRCVAALTDWVRHGISICMNRYNAANEPKKKVAGDRKKNPTVKSGGPKPDVSKAPGVSETPDAESDSREDVDSSLPGNKRNAKDD